MSTLTIFAKLEFPVLHWDNAKSEMSQCVKDIHAHLIIVDTWREPPKPWQNLAELCVVKYLKNQCQVLGNCKGANNNLWFLYQQYIADIHHACAHSLFNWQSPAWVSGGTHQTYCLC